MGRRGERDMLSGKQGGNRVDNEEQKEAIVKAIITAFEYERDTTLEGTKELERISGLTKAECDILANAAINAVSLAGYDLVLRNHAPRT